MTFHYNILARSLMRVGLLFIIPSRAATNANHLSRFYGDRYTLKNRLIWAYMCVSVCLV